MTAKEVDELSGGQSDDRLQYLTRRRNMQMTGREGEGRGRNENGKRAHGGDGGRVVIYVEREEDRLRREPLGRVHALAMRPGK